MWVVQRRRWLVLLGLVISLGLLVLAAYLWTRGLDEADKIGSVVSMFTGIGGLLASVLISIVMSRRTQSPSGDGKDYWAIKMMRERTTDPSGAVLYTGIAHLPNGTEWDWEDYLSVHNVLASTWSTRAVTIAALGHSRRLDLLQQVLTSATADVELDHNGQDRVHIAALVRGGWLVQTGAGRYRVPGSRVVPLLSILMAAEDH